MLKHLFKQSEVGPIPATWTECCLEDIAAISSGGTPSRDNPGYWNGTVPWVTTAQVNFNDISESEEYITEAGLRNSAAKVLPPGTLLMALYGQGKTRGKVGVLRMAAATNQACASISVRGDVSSEFVRYFLTNRYDAIRNASNAGGQENLSGQIVKRLPIALPSLPEQRAIATALSDVDALIASLDRLIAKKRDLKQATMQQLLTGRTRLPGFGGDWEVKRLGDYVKFLRHGVNSRAELLPEGRVRYLHYGDVHACKGTYITPDSLPCLSDAKAARLNRLRDGDLVFADASEDVVGVTKSVEVRGVGSTELVSGLHTIAARFDKTVLADGFKGFLQFCPQFATHLRRLAAGTKVYATSRAHIASVEMRLPLAPEQVAIATVLADMDAELAGLDQRRRKTRLLKQSLMQELLTGRTRLV